MKTINNNTLNIINLNETVTLHGWVAKKRDLGGLIFIDLRDKSGIVQLMVRPDAACYNAALNLKSEFVIEVTGVVVERESKNPNLETGEIEINVTNLKTLNTSKDLPFQITGNVNALEDTRLKYRYLDLRRDELKNIMTLRSNVMF